MTDAQMDWRFRLEEMVRTQFPEESGQLVFGEGPEHPTLLLIGEAPGAQEALMKRPFVGKAGKNLDEFLALAGLAREELYITNTVKFRPTRVGKTGRLSNRPPTSSELARFVPLLLEEIALTAPKAVVTLGNVPLQAVTDKTRTIGEVHGTWQRTSNGLKLFPLYHPASIIYNRSLEAVYQEDIKKLAAEIGTL